jgi:hypothetical protein
LKILTRQEVDMLRAWDNVARRYRQRYLSRGSSRFQFKEYAYREVYGTLLKQIVKDLPTRHPYILKTDSWNEGVEDGRNLITCVNELRDNDDDKGISICTDVSRYVCELANQSKAADLSIIQATLLASPFRPVFDLLIDASTIDHMPRGLRRPWLASEASTLKPNGLLMVSFDCRLNIFVELYHRFVTRTSYPEWTLTPAEVRGQIESLGFRVVREHAVFVAGFLWGSHRPSFILARCFQRQGVLKFVRNRELSRNSKWLSFLAPQYVIVARKTSSDWKRGSPV